MFHNCFVSVLDILFDLIVSVLCLGGWQEEERVVLELDLVVPLTQSQSFLPGKARQKYIRDVCQTPVISYDLKNHYKLKTNWEQLKKLQMGEDESNVKELGDIEAHTYCMYKNGYTESKLPGSTLDPGSIHPEVSKLKILI